MTDLLSAQPFIDKWKGVEASELSTSQSFLLDLCRLLGVDAPHASAEQDYMFERPITFVHGDGSTSAGRIDLYRRGAFVLESKKVRGAGSARGFDEALLRARGQAEGYARALPASEGRPPFVVVVDVGRRIELYSEFSRSGATYTPFPDPRSHRIDLADLARDDVRERLRRVWTDPLSLDPAREAARVTREIAARLAELARSLESARHAPETVAQFLMRCLFTMFAEDVGLLPADAFRDLLEKHRDNPDVAMRMLGQLWRDMDAGGFSAVIAGDVLRFNGKLFKAPDTLPLDKAQILLLVEAAKAKWEHVEPAIFGTLLERALDQTERHKLGAHYTPRAYVERLVLPTVIEPLRAEWSDAQAAALTLAAEGKHDEAVKTLRAFHHRLCTVRVLDPACGSGNFLYVTLEHLKRLEGEVLNALDELGFRQTGLALGGERADAQAGETVDPHNLLGIEKNPRAAAIAEVVLWIGYLQWHFRTRGNVNPPIPVIRDFRNIENRDAVLAWDSVEYVTDERGVPVTRWDGVTMKTSPVTGEPIPDDSTRVPVERYVNPRKAAWPEADFVVGNPPFIGNKRMRLALGDGYVEALRATWDDVPESADFVMYWWHHAALIARRGALRRFGFITTNSIRQTFNRRVIEAALSPPSPRRGEGEDQALSLVFAIPDHPWVDTADGAAVRIAMTVASAERVGDAVLREVADEREGVDEVAVTLRETRGTLHSDLRVGANISGIASMQGNLGLSFMGMIPLGEGFWVTPEEAHALSLGVEAAIAPHVRPYRNGKDILYAPRGVLALDFFGMDETRLRSAFPAAYQWLLERVKPARANDKRKSYRENWWYFAEARPAMRKALASLCRYIGTTETSKHRVFMFLDSAIVPDQKIRVVASDDAVVLGILSSQVHVTWALAAGARLGVGNDPVYNGSRCFEPFPFPATTGEQQSRIRALAEQLDAHRKRQQAAHPDLTLTGMYNVLEKLRSGEVLTTKERTIHEHGLVSVLRQLHDELDAAVLDAYGWSDLLPLLRVAHNTAVRPGSGTEGAQSKGVRGGASTPLAAQAALSANGENEASPSSAATKREEAKRAFDEAILERLVALNAERAAEEARGLVRWLRPEFQNPQAGAKPEQAEIDTAETPDEVVAPAIAVAKPSAWPKEPVNQVRAVADLLAATPSPLSLDDIAARFTARGPWKKRLPQLLEMLVALGRAREQDGRYSAAR